MAIGTDEFVRGKGQRMRCAACSGTGETTDGMCSSCLGTGLVGLSRPQNAINTDLAARLAKAERERDDLRHDVERHIAAASSEAARAEAAEARLTRMREALEEAEKVIAPLAKYAAKYDTPEYDQFDWAAIAVGHLRAARKWMESCHD